MTTEHVSVPRELFDMAREQIERQRLAALEYGLIAVAEAHSYALHKIDAIISRATPSDVCDFCGGDCSAANPPVATCPLITQGVDAAIDTMRKVNKEKPSAPRVVTDEDVRVACMAYGECAEFEHMRAALESFATSLPAARVPDRKKLRALVDAAWMEATETEQVPSTIWADRIIDSVLAAALQAGERG